jgi:hypothetical protein
MDKTWKPTDPEGYIPLTEPFITDFKFVLHHFHLLLLLLTSVLKINGK